VLGTVTYSSTRYAGTASLRWASGLPSGHGTGWTDLAAADFSVRGYLQRDSNAQAGSVAWSAAAGSALLTTDGGLSWFGLSVPAESIPPEAWVRVEFRRQGATGHLEVYTDPASDTPSAADTDTVDDSALMDAWFFERWGTGGIWWDELALANHGDGLGPIPVADPGDGVFLGPGVPMFAG
jgi:hypothetical protein